MITTCPQCNTKFRVTHEQLAAHQGLVRCGQCTKVFNGFANLQSEETVGALNAETHPETIHALSGHIERTPPKPEWTPAIDNENIAEKEKAAAASPSPHPDETPVPAPFILQGHINELPPQPLWTPTGQEGGQTIKTKSPVDNTPSIPLHPHPLNEHKPASHKQRGIWIIACFLLTILFAGQIAYLLRTEILVKWPGTKPYLTLFCERLGCEVSLPKQIDEITIEASEMLTDPSRPNVVLVTAILRNRSVIQQSWPLLEITFTDTLDHPVARRSLKAIEYLDPSEKKNQGLAPNSETTTRMAIEAIDIKPAGYQLRLYYR